MVVDRQMMTGHPGVFAGGDMVPSERTVTVPWAMARRPRAASTPGCAAATYESPRQRPVVTFDMLNLPVFSDVDPAVQTTSRTKSGCPVSTKSLGGLSEPRHDMRRSAACPAATASSATTATQHAPRQAIVKLGPGLGYSVDPAKCTGCGTCFEQCPCHAIEMVAER